MIDQTAMQAETAQSADKSQRIPFGEAILSRLGGFVSAVVWVVTRPFAGLHWLWCLRVPLSCVEGEEQTSHLPLSIICAASGPEKIYLLKLIFGDSYRERSLGRYWIWNVDKAIAKAPESSLLIVGCETSHLSYARPEEWFLIPSWLLGAVDLPYEGNVTGNFRSYLRRQMKRQEYQFEVRRDLQAFDDFYQQMYVPYVSQTFGDCVYMTSYKRMKAFFQDGGELLLVKQHQEEKAIAGTLIRYKEEGPYLWELGIRDGNREYVKEGAGRAVYHYLFEYLLKQGHKKVFVGYSRTFLHDGVLEFKRRWSQRIVNTNTDGFALRVLSPTPATRAFLCSNPFIFERNDETCAAVYVDVDKPLRAEDIQQIDKDYFHPGLTRLFIYYYQDETTNAPDPVPAELAERVELRCAGKVTGDSSRISSDVPQLDRAGQP